MTGTTRATRCSPTDVRQDGQMDLVEARRRAIEVAERIIAETVTPYEGARMIWTDVWSELDEQLHELDSFVNDATDWEEHPERRLEIESDIRAEAARLAMGWPRAPR